ncbi:Fe-S protein assembly co-chaperone HscB [Acidithiobacillus ferriphilus]|jgi:Fe-S protein assembly co-chaperone HscB|uniref:Fe-S protein assembly co-chaperone HscB n=1 Tax=Acidithiobacillus ferriphilus TaxID=1689834 RepID=UPI001C06597B|nr:Fe-S protein assembly co-chaperone HscB [Acidithiobacillus ferriphilus]MBU2846203.1 Fe-S protein assembly co-chaperone HscB [Acidithiobacillus ferriphilus]
MADSCFQCGAELVAPPALCASCGAVQPFRADLSLFTVAGLSEIYDLDVQTLRTQVFALQKGLHPDRFAHAEPTARRYSLEWSTRLNEALATLRDPLKRADYLLRCQGVDALGEQVKVADPELLMTQMIYRERLENIMAARDLPGMEALRQEVDKAVTKVVQRLKELLAILPCTELEAAGSAVRELQFLDKLVGEIDRSEESLQNV